MLKKFFLPILCLLFATFFLQSYGQGISLPDWTVLSDENQKVDLIDTVFLGKPCVKLDGNIISAIWNKKLNLKNFSLDLDIAGAVMPGIGFHASDAQNYQLLYFRPGYGGTIEAIQYIPIYNGALSWVFYGDYQASADIHLLEWFHTRLEVRGNNLKVFCNRNKKADLDITMLPTDAERGSVLLRTMFGTAYFANLNYRELPEGIKNWDISEQLPAGITYGDAQLKKIKQWRHIDETRDEYVNLSRYFKMPEGTVFAKHIIHADTAEHKLLHFDFTGTMHILLNGKEIFNYDKYKLDRVEAGTNVVRLALQKGDNDLVFITQGDGYIFGKGYNSVGRLQHQNWGFIASIENTRL